MKQIPQLKYSIGNSASGIDLDLSIFLNCECLLQIDVNLTRAEFEVAQLFVFGSTYVQMAKSRNVAKETVKSQVSSLLSKTQMENRLELVLFVFSINLQNRTNSNTNTSYNISDFHPDKHQDVGGEPLSFHSATG